MPDELIFDRIPPLTDPTALPRVLGYADAIRLGFTPAEIRHRLRTGRWTRILPHTYLTGDTLIWDDQLRAAIAFAGDGALLSGAAALYGRGLTSVRRPDTVLVIVPPGRKTRSAGWVRVRPSERWVARATAPGLPRVADARAVADLAVELARLDDVRALVSEVVRRRRCSIEELADELRHGPQRGSAHLREAIDEVGGGAWSAPEARAGTLLRRAHVPAFTQNRRIDLPDGTYVIVDFLWPELRAVLEIDSDAHHALAGEAADRTSDRHLRLETAGYSTIHRSPRLVIREPTRFVDGVLAWLTGRANELAGSPTTLLPS